MSHHDEACERLTFLGRCFPPAFALRVVTLAPGETKTYDEAEWRGALVLVERGAIELESYGYGYYRFERGAVLWLAALPLRALHNRGPERAVLSALSRRRSRPTAPLQCTAAMSFPPRPSYTDDTRRRGA